jgi:O-antigen ligase
VIATPLRDARTRRTLDDAGLTVPVAAAAFAAWSVAVSDIPLLQVLPVVAGWLVLGGAFLLGRYLASDPVPVTLVLSGALLAFLVAATISQRELYPNAAAAVAVQALALCLVACQVDEHHPWRGALFWTAAALCAVPFLEVSVAAIVGAFLVAAAFLLAAAAPSRRTSVGISLAGGGLLAVCVAAQLLIATGGLTDARVVAALSMRRQQLWHDAVLIGESSPWTGQGLGSFAELSPTAADPDTVRAHSLLLQTYAEAGLVGVGLLALLVLAVVWVLIRRAAPAVAPVAVAAWLALCLQALVDYVTDAPIVLAAAGVVAGVAVASGRTQPRTAGGTPQPLSAASST